jgi:taurine dioxygenase
LDGGGGGRNGLTVASFRPLGEGTLGTEVIGLDLSQALDRDQFAWIEATFVEHPVLVFRGQHLDATTLDGYARRFGTPQRHVLERYRHKAIPKISFITNVDADGNIDPFGVKRATKWHADATYEAKLPRLAMLHALEVPSAGGGTLFADMGAAYDALPADLRQQIQGRTGLHRFNAGPAGGASIYAGQALGDQLTDQRHPAVLCHPASGRSILFVNPSHTFGFEDMAADRGWQLVEALSDHAIQERFVYYHRWQVGDLVMWDELATMHRGAGDSRPEEHRVMLRSIVYPG